MERGAGRKNYGSEGRGERELWKRWARKKDYGSEGRGQRTRGARGGEKERELGERGAGRKN